MYGCVVRLLTFVEGRVMKQVAADAQSDALLFAAGSLVGKMDRLLDTLSHPGFNRVHLWNSRNSLELRQFLYCVTDTSRRQMCEMVLNQFENVVLPLAENMSSTQPLRMGVIHGDAN